MGGIGKQVVGADHSMREFKKDGGEILGEQEVN